MVSCAAVFHVNGCAQVLKNVKNSVEVRNSVCHSAVVFANAIMHSGTTVDSFLRENLDWLSRATNWSKFSATAGLGVIHRGHLSQVRPYVQTDRLHSYQGAPRLSLFCRQLIMGQFPNLRWLSLPVHGLYSYIKAKILDRL